MDEIADTPTTGASAVCETPLVLASDETLAGYGRLVDDGGQLCQPLGGESFVVPLALPGDDVRPGSFFSFRCGGGRGLLSDCG